MAEHKFRAFLESKRWGHGPDFLFFEYARDDPDLPDAESWDELEAHLSKHNAAPEMRDSAKAIWQLYVDKGR